MATKIRWTNETWNPTIRDACQAKKVAFFFKQDSGPRTELRPWLDGMIWEQYPGSLTLARSAAPDQLNRLMRAERDLEGGGSSFARAG